VKLWVSRIPSIESKAISMSLMVSVVLLVIKFVAFFATHSAAIFSDAVESIANVMASGVAFWALAVAHSPADEEHPYGHGKAEFLSAMFEGSMILAAAAFILFRTGDAIWTESFVQEQHLDLGLLLVVVALVINGLVGLYLIRTGRRQGSMTLEADGRHLMSDALTSVAVLVALAMVRITGWSWFDPITAVLIGVYIGLMALSLLRRSFAGLMDQQEPEDVQLLTTLLGRHVGSLGQEPRICDYHKLRHRHSGRFHWVDFHIMVPAAWTIDHGHAVAKAIEDELQRELGEADATAHVEPCEAPGCPNCQGTAQGKHV
jgi:cation diffusion facilitator family transporter